MQNGIHTDFLEPHRPIQRTSAKATAKARAFYESLRSSARSQSSHAMPRRTSFYKPGSACTNSLPHTRPDGTYPIGLTHQHQLSPSSVGLPERNACLAVFRTHSEGHVQPPGLKLHRLTASPRTGSTLRFSSGSHEDRRPGARVERTGPGALMVARRSTTLGKGHPESGDHGCDCWGR